MNTLKDTLDDDQDPDYAATVPSDQTQQKAYEENGKTAINCKINLISQY